MAKFVQFEPIFAEFCAGNFWRVVTLAGRAAIFVFDEAVVANPVTNLWGTLAFTKLTPIRVNLGKKTKCDHYRRKHVKSTYINMFF